MDVVVGILCVVGAGFVAVAGLGVVRFGDLYARMHAATKASTIAVVLLAAAAALAVDGAATRVLLAAAVVFVTAPSAAHLIARAGYHDEGIDPGLDGIDDLAPAADPDPDPDHPQNPELA